MVLILITFCWSLHRSIPVKLELSLEKQFQFTQKKIKIKENLNNQYSLNNQNNQKFSCCNHLSIHGVLLSGVFTHHVNIYILCCLTLLAVGIRPLKYSSANETTVSKLSTSFLFFFSFFRLNIKWTPEIPSWELLLDLCSTKNKQTNKQTKTTTELIN